MFYASNDWTVNNEYSFGFANTKIILAFKTKAERDEYLATTKDLSAKSLTRKEAIKYDPKGYRISHVNEFGHQDEFTWSGSPR